MSDHDITQALREAHARTHVDDDFDLDGVLRGGERRVRRRRTIHGAAAVAAAAVVVVSALVLAPRLSDTESVETFPAARSGSGVPEADIAEPPVARRIFELTTHDPGKIVPQALLSSGVVKATEQGCPYVQLEGAKDVPLLWPQGWTATRGAGRWVYTDPTGKISVREGDTPYFVGGYGQDTRDPCGLIEGTAFKIYIAR